MKTEYLLISAGVLLTITFITIFFTAKKTRKKNLKKQLDDLYVRFNSVKTVPLAFKLNKAQTMARRSEEMSASVESYYKKYEETEKHINEIQDMLNDVDDNLDTRMRFR